MSDDVEYEYSGPSSIDLLDSVHFCLKDFIEGSPELDMLNVLFDLHIAFHGDPTQTIFDVYKRLQNHSAAINLLSNPIKFSCSREEALALPYLSGIWQYFKQFPGDFDTTTFSGSKASVEVNQTVQELCMRIYKLDLHEVLNVAAAKWNPLSDHVIDVCLLYTIWAAAESGCYGMPSIYSLILKCVHPAFPFLGVFLACLLFNDAKIAAMPDNESTPRHFWGNLSTGQYILSGYQKAAIYLKSSTDASKA